MNPYIEISKHMRQQGAVYNPPSIEIGQMLSQNIVKIGDLQINRNNLYVPFGLDLHNGDTVAIMPTSDKQIYIILNKVVKA